MKLGCNFIQLLAPFQASVPSIVEKEGIDLVKERKSMMMIMASFITTSWAFQGLFAEWCPVIKFFFIMVCRNCCRLSSGPIHLQLLKFLLSILFSSWFPNGSMFFWNYQELFAEWCPLLHLCAYYIVRMHFYHL